MKLMTPSQMKQIDKEAINCYHIPGILLMEHAAYQVYKVLEKDVKEGKVVIVCGPGNNGGDGLALARQISTWSAKKVMLLVMGQREQFTEDGKVYYDICKQLEIPMLQVNDETKDKAFQMIEEAEYLVDAIFGTGLGRNIEGIFREIIAKMNEAEGLKIAVDIPSGISGEDGTVKAIAFKAEHTVTFAAPKLGLYLYPAIDYTGNVHVVDIGIPKAIIDKTETNYYSIEKQEFKIPKRPTRSNKGTYGKVLVVGGKCGLSGAPCMTAMAALKVGAGLVTAAVPKSIYKIIETKLTEVMTLPLKDQNGEFAKEAADELKEVVNQYDVYAIGPGLGRAPHQKKMLLKVLETQKPCVIDADGLFYVSELLEVISSRKAETVLTPHPGEMARMTGLKLNEIMENPIEIARNFAIKNRVILVLKMERVVIADSSGNIYINRAGNPGMAKGGSGDLLTGVITGLIAQGFSPLEAAKLGSYIHARAGDKASDKKTQYTFLPTDLYEEIDEVFKEFILS